MVRPQIAIIQDHLGARVEDDRGNTLRHINRVDLTMTTEGTRATLTLDIVSLGVTPDEVRIHPDSMDALHRLLKKAGWTMVPMEGR